jgi:hypothetical protein
MTTEDSTGTAIGPHAGSTLRLRVIGDSSCVLRPTRQVQYRPQEAFDPTRRLACNSLAYLQP